MASVKVGLHDEELTHHEGKTSLSDAMATKLLLASLEQNLTSVLFTARLVAMRAGANVDRARSVEGTRALALQ